MSNTLIEIMIFSMRKAIKILEIQVKVKQNLDSIPELAQFLELIFIILINQYLSFMAKYLLSITEKI
jgi:uncharacterized protein involved in cysteine biosynthesis